MMLHKQTQSIQDVSESYNKKWPICPITQDKIIVPVAVHYKQQVDSDVYTVRMYESAAIMAHVRESLSQNKPLLDPFSKQPIEKCTLDLTMFEQQKALSSQASSHGIVDKKTHDEYLENCQLGLLHHYVQTRKSLEFLSELAKIKKHNPILEKLHYFTGRPALHDLIIFTSMKVTGDGYETFTTAVLDLFLAKVLNTDTRDSSNVTPLMQAAMYGNLTAFKYFLSKEEISKKDNLDNTVLHYITNATFSITEHLLTIELMFRLAVDAGADILSRNAKNKTPLGTLAQRIAVSEQTYNSYLVRCLEYVAEKMPEKLIEHAELQIDSDVDERVNLFKSMVFNLELPAARCLIQAGCSIGGCFSGRNSSALHFLAEKLALSSLPLKTRHEIHRTIEALIFAGLSPDILNLDKKKFNEVNPIYHEEPLDVIEFFAVKGTFMEFIAKRNWLFFANHLSMGFLFEEPLTNSLLAGILSNPEESFLYKRCLRIILSKMPANMLVEGNDRRVSMDCFAIEEDNAIALEVMIELNRLSMSTKKLHAYAVLMGADDKILSMLQSEPVNAPLMQRRNSMPSLLFGGQDRRSANIPSSDAHGEVMRKRY